MVTIEGKEYLRVSEAARRLGVNRRTVRRWIVQELLPAVDLGEEARLRYLVPASALDGFEPPSASGPGRPAGSGKARLSVPDGWTYDKETDTISTVAADGRVMRISVTEDNQFAVTGDEKRYKLFSDALEAAQRIVESKQ